MKKWIAKVCTYLILFILISNHFDLDIKSGVYWVISVILWGAIYCVIDGIWRNK